MAPAQG
ncbi:hypothetical protein LINGRAPRIM_LOCUS3409 [Linum grandiflorum]